MPVTPMNGMSSRTLASEKNFCDVLKRHTQKSAIHLNNIQSDSIPSDEFSSGGFHTRSILSMMTSTFGFIIFFIVRKTRPGCVTD